MNIHKVLQELQSKGSLNELEFLKLLGKNEYTSSNYLDQLFKRFKDGVIYRKNGVISLSDEFKSVPVEEMLNKMSGLSDGNCGACMLQRDMLIDSAIRSKLFMYCGATALIVFLLTLTFVSSPVYTTIDCDDLNQIEWQQQ